MLDYETQVPKAELRSFTGLMTWVANICPQCNAFCRMLWGALTADSKSWTFPKQIRLPLLWLSKFVADQTEPLQRNFRPPSPLHLCLTFDGSPTGGGATLQVALPSMSCRTSHPISFYWQTQWTSHDEHLLSARIGDPGSQARWEAYTLLLACIRWMPAVAQSNSTVHFVGDASGVLCDA